MSAVFGNSFYNNNTSNQIINGTMFREGPCPTVPPYVVTYFTGSPIGWNAALVGLLSSILAILFLLTCLYYLFCRRRQYDNETSEIPSSVALIEKNGTSSTIPVTSQSQTATTTFINEGGKETKINTYTEQGTTATNEFNVSMANGHTSSLGTNGLLANGNADPSELRLLQHEHH